MEGGSSALGVEKVKGREKKECVEKKRTDGEEKERKNKTQQTHTGKKGRETREGRQRKEEWREEIMETLAYKKKKRMYRKGRRKEVHKI